MASQQTLNRGGKKAKRMKKRVDIEGNVPSVVKDPDDNFQDYGIVTKTRGGGRYSVLCFTDKTTRIGLKRGTMARGTKRAIILDNDIVLVSLRDFQPEWCDIIHKYSPQHIVYLNSCGLIPSSSEIDHLIPKYGIQNKTEQANPDPKDNDTGFDFSTI